MGRKCKIAQSEYNKEYYARTRETQLAYKREERRQLVKEIFEHYGNKCICCGEDQIEFLTMDHINGDGAAHRKKINSKGGAHFYRWIRNNGFPDFLQIPCMNCNCAKQWYGKCPHEDQPDV